MDEPITAGSSSRYDPDSDFEIQQQLASRNCAQISQGLESLAEREQTRVANLLRKWSIRRNWRLTNDDIAEIWTATLTSIWESARDGKFQIRLKLNGFISSIAYLRAIDQIRARNKDGRELPRRDVLMLVAPPAEDENFDTNRGKFARLLQHRYWKKLSEKERLVMNHLIDFVIENNADPSRSELTEYINKHRLPDDQLSEAAVKSAKQRAFAKLSGKKRKSNG